MVIFTPRAALFPGKIPVPTEYEAMWVPGPFRTFGEGKNLLILLRFEPRILRSVA